jgi:hypothetical protein
MQDDQLIFMISLPRSGSTLLQKILGGHSDIYTRSEPWLMLHPLYSLKSDGIQARYDARLAAQGVQDFISDLPGTGEDFYYARLRDCYLSLYAPYLQSSGKSRFLDKTPRYYEVFDELQKTFPQAKFIILYRNPLAVLASILETWVKGDLAKLKEYRGDLYKGIEFLQRDFSSYSNTHIVRYEELLLDPESAMAMLFAFLQLPNQPECIDYGKRPAERWRYGDPRTVYAKSRPDAQHADAWQRQLSIAKNRKLLADYLQMLGKTGFERMGYDYAHAEQAITQSMPANYTAAALPSLRQLLRLPDEENKTLHVETTKLLAENKSLHAESTRLHTELARLLEDNKALRAESTKPHTESTKLHAEIAKPHVEIAKLFEDNESLQSESLKLREENGLTLRQLHLVQVQQESLQSESLKLREDNKSLHDESLKLREDNKSLHDESLKLREDNKSLHDESLKLREENGLTLRQLHLVQVQQESLQSESLKLREENKSLHDESLKLRYDNKSLQEEKRTLQSEITKLKHSLQQHSARIETLENKLAGIFQSTESLKEHRALLQPKRKLKAYKNLLNTINTAREHHAPRSATNQGGTPTGE